MSLVVLQQKTDPSREGSHLNSLLVISVSKTKEMCFCTKLDRMLKSVILGQPVKTFKYLGTVLERQLSFTKNSPFLKECSQ